MRPRFGPVRRARNSAGAVRICVYGAGAIGGALAARLARAGHDVAMVARGRQLEAIRANGLRFDSHGDPYVAKVAVADDPAALGAHDVVITAVKAHDLPAVAAALDPLLKPASAIVYAVNGIPWWYFYGCGDQAAERRIARLDPTGALWALADRSIGCVVNFASSVVSPGVVHHEAATNRLALGEPRGGDSARLAAIAEALRGGGFDVTTAAPIRQEVWTKLRRVVATSAITALTGLASGAAAASPDLRPLFRAAMLEINRIAASYGYPLPDDIDARLDQQTASPHRPSMLQDLEAGRRLELDAQLVVPLEMARAAGVAVPTMELLVALLTAKARGAGLY